MPSTSALGLFAIAALLVLMVPGPAVLYIATRSIEQGRAAGLASVLGVATGGLFHVVAAAAGLSAVLAASGVAFTVCKLAGAAYLVVLGLGRILRVGPRTEFAAAPRADIRRTYVQGIVIQVLNPKTAVFFLAFLPQFVDPAKGSVAVQILVLGTLFVILGICSDTAWALLTSAAGTWLQRQPVFRRRGERLAGAIYVGLGLTTALLGHRPVRSSG